MSQRNIYPIYSLIYIAGAERSGSTLLDTILGEGKSCFSIGEFRQFWKSFILKNGLCTCQKNYKDCPFWGQILKELFGNTGNIKNIAMYYYKLQKIVERIPLVNLKKQKEYLFKYHKEISEFGSFLKEIYNKVIKFSSAKIIIDSSKVPYWLIVLKNFIPNLMVIHLVRDLRAVTYSWTKRKFDYSINNYMKTHHPFTTARNWLKYNIALEKIKSELQYYYFLRYEDFVNNPNKYLREIEKSFNLEKNIFPEIRNYQLLVKKDRHQVGGNPDRFKMKNIQIKGDFTWKKQLPLKYKIFITMLTFPFLKRYKYLF